MKKLILGALVSLISLNAFSFTEPQFISVMKKQDSMVMKGATAYFAIEKLVHNAFNEYEAMSPEQLSHEMRIVSLKKTGACGIADLFIITSGVLESIPGAAAVPKIIAKDDSETKTQLIVTSVTGSLLASIPDVLIESASSYDIKKIEATIQDSFEASNKLAYKLKGDKSYCAEMKVRLDVLDSIANGN